MAGIEISNKKAHPHETEEEAEDEEQMASHADQVEPAEAIKRPRGRPRNAERFKKDDNHTMDNFISSKNKNNEEVFSRSFKTSRSPQRVEVKENEGIDKETLFRWMEEIRETMKNNKKDMIEEMLNAIKNLNKDIARIELESAKKEKRWERERELNF